MRFQFARTGLLAAFKKNARGLIAAVCVALFSLAQTMPSQAQTSEADEPAWFKTESLNGGLGDAPDSVDRTTPEDAVDSLLELIRRQKFDAAAQLLDLSEIPDQEQAL